MCGVGGEEETNGLSLGGFVFFLIVFFRMISNILHLMSEFCFQILPATPRKEKHGGNDVEKNFVLAWSDRKTLDVDQNVR